ncbi:flagellar motor protein MotB [Cohnella cholangitidis]|uniref:Flagellar motor protein MotB n=1 Tax=Cohnella cholangitidis TaxID=2598458 RepID=A0A7G5BZC6_9BACL|nr:flagellar motor protein MotB [Cohnella cholangitidis]QMV42310.1 flagellar motor protein MotB [Cohnella cholangitidis]
MSRKRHEPHEEHADESWLLPYSDLMTLLLALFIVLYAASAVNTSKFEEMSRAFKTAFSSGLGIMDKGAITQDYENKRNTNQDLPRANDGKKDKSREELKQQEQQNLEQLQKELNKYIDKNGLSSQLETQLNQSQLLITIRDNALFPSGSASIKTDSQKLASAIGQMLQQYPDYEILVTGHTDNQPINTSEFPSNWELSSKRAINFMKILLENTAFDPSRFSAIGYGEFRPLESNASDAGRAKNRRVEVSILRNYLEPADSSNEITLNAIAGEGKKAE